MRLPCAVTSEQCDHTTRAHTDGDAARLARVHAEISTSVIGIVLDQHECFPPYYNIQRHTAHDMAKGMPAIARVAVGMPQAQPRCATLCALLLSTGPPHRTVDRS